ncbi:MAG TPA: hypothetical protein VJS42_01485 [Steroidobacteraceae bacterium]|nr:hypothetical protein [Steroidobacteraceae bacterium]
MSAPLIARIIEQLTHMNVSLLQRAIQVPVPHENVPRSRGAKEGFPLVYVL